VLAIVDGRRVRLQSRQQRLLARYFPEVVQALREWFAGEVVLNGVIWGREQGVQHVADGRLSLPVSWLWTAYLWSVYDGSWLLWTAQAWGGTSTRPGCGLAVPSSGCRRCSSGGNWTVCAVGFTRTRIEPPSPVTA
jgi:hypothetical protein